MIKSYKDEKAKSIFSGFSVKQYKNFEEVARRKLRYLNNAKTLSDLRVPPGNRLEPLEGKRKGQHSIRINDQYRICFKWKDGDAYEIEITDYH